MLILEASILVSLSKPFNYLNQQNIYGNLSSQKDQAV